MIYEFKDQQTGERVEIAYPAGQAPGLGCVVKHNGRWVKRVVSVPAALKPNGLTRFKPHAADSLPRWHPDAPAHDAEGRAIVTSRAEQQRMVAKMNERKVKAGDPKLIHTDD